jgi:predicted nucleotidyltransferase
MDRAEAIRKAREYLKQIENTIRFKEAFIFGSYASGKPDEASDIDIGIFIDSLSEDYFLVLKKLYRARHNVDVRIEPHLFITGHDPAGFSESVKKEGIAL